MTEHKDNAAPDTDDYKPLAMSDFVPYEGTAFHITLPELGDIEFTLDSVYPTSGSNVPESVLRQALGKDFPHRQSFALLFLGPQDMGYDQGCFDVTHKETGFRTNMFLVPIKGPYSKADEDVHVFFQAVFN